MKNNAAMEDHWSNNPRFKSKQEPVAVVETIGGYPDESAHVAKWLVPYKSLKAGDKLYTTRPQPTEPEQEPVARMLVKDGIGLIEWKNPIRLSDGLHDLYTTPPQRTWVELTDEEVEAIYRAVDGNEFPIDFYKEIKAKLKEKNP